MADKEKTIKELDRITSVLFDSLTLLQAQPEIVRCGDCEYSYVEGFVHERLLCEKHPELGELTEDWFCADCWKA